MPPIVIDPSSYDKATAFADAVALCEDFLSLNGISRPKFVPDRGPIPGKWKDFGMYDHEQRTVWVNLKKTRAPTRTPGFSWTFTGYKADLTAPGVTAHEVGHHVHCELAVSLRDLHAVSLAERPVSGYEPHLGEMFAEAARLFILNPDLLRVGRPVRWELMTSVLGLKPIHAMDWRAVLANAHTRLIAAAESWIVAGRRVPKRAK